MASFLDTGLLGFFSLIFTFLLVYAIIWGLLLWKQPFGKGAKNIYGIISFAISFLLIISDSARMFIEFITPWFLVLAIFIFLIMMVMSVFTKDIKWLAVASDSAVYTTILVVAIIIVIVGLAVVFGQRTLDSGKTSPSVPTTQINNSLTVPSYGQANYIETGANAPGINVPTGPTGTADYGTNAVNTLFHPKVLGVILVLLMSTLIIYFLSRPAV